MEILYLVPRTQIPHTSTFKVGPVYSSKKTVYDDGDFTLNLIQNQWGFKKIEVNSYGVFLDDKYELQHVEIHGQPEENCFSIHLPRVQKSMNKEEMKEIFDLLEWGEIERIDLVNKSITDNFQKAFVHFKKETVTNDFLAAFNHLWSREDAKLRITPQPDYYWWVCRISTKMIDMYCRRIVIDFSSESESEDEDEDEY
jgi:hypothetical protein